MTKAEIRNRFSFRERLACTIARHLKSTFKDETDEIGTVYHCWWNDMSMTIIRWLLGGQNPVYFFVDTLIWLGEIPERFTIQEIREHYAEWDH